MVQADKSTSSLIKVDSAAPARIVQISASSKFQVKVHWSSSLLQRLVSPFLNLTAASYLKWRMQQLRVVGQSGIDSEECDYLLNALDVAFRGAVQAATRAEEDGKVDIEAQRLQVWRIF